ncbi:MAG: hypothetical protein K2K38_04485 [Clostridia bacterium]|nr:hypothetical protein [Clostridia bacterium]
MADKKIVIQLDDKGGIKAETFGMVGTECLDELDKLMKGIALSGTTEKKKEFFEQETTTSNKVVNKRD